MSGSRRALGGKPRVVLGVVGVVAVAAVAAALSGGLKFGGDPKETGGKPPLGTATVTRTTVTVAVNATGEVGYGQPLPVTSRAAGTLTWLAPVGSTVKRGEPLLRADNNPVVLLYGNLPFYRPINVGVKGPDVGQLETNLRELNYTGFDADENFTASTTAAVKRWQRDLGLEPTGVVDPATVIVAPGAVRIVAHSARLGTSASADVLTASPTTRIVTASVPAAKPELSKKGAKATVTLPDGTAVQATVAGVVEPPSPGGQESEQAAPPAGDAEPQVTVQLNLQHKGELPPGPVDIVFVTDEHANVLAVPVHALLAIGDRGFGVEIREGATSRVVPVQTGLFSSGKVEISGDGIAEGVTVVMPQ